MDNKWQYLSLTRTDRVLTVEFSSGNKVNSLNHALMRELTQLAIVHPFRCLRELYSSLAT